MKMSSEDKGLRRKEEPERMVIRRNDSMVESAESGKLMEVGRRRCCMHRMFSCGDHRRGHERVCRWTGGHLIFNAREALFRKQGGDLCREQASTSGNRILWLPR